MIRVKDGPFKNDLSGSGSNKSERLNRRCLAVFPFFLLILSLFVRSRCLTSQEIGLDEPFSIYHAQFDWSTLIAQLSAYNNPPLYELVLHGWIKLFGISPLAVRSLPMLIASLCPLVLFYFAKRHFSVFIAVTSSLLLSFSSLLQYYAHDCRAYTLFLLLALLSMYFFMAQLQSPRFWPFIRFIVFTCLLIYTHYFGIFILFFQVIYVLIFYRARILRSLISYAVIFLLYLPQLLVLKGRMGDSVKNGTWLRPPVGVESLYNMLWAFSNYPFVTVLCMLLLLSGLAVRVKRRTFSSVNSPLVLILVWFLAPFLGMFLISFWVPMYIPRYLIFVLPAYYILLAFCLERLPVVSRWRLVVTLAFLVCFACTLKSDPDKKQKGREAVSLLKQLKDPSTLVLVFPGDYLPGFAYYYNPDYFATVDDCKEYHLTDSLLRTEQIYVLNKPEDLSTPQMSNYKKIIYIGVGEDYHSPQDPVFGKLMESRAVLYTRQFNDNYKLEVFR